LASRGRSSKHEPRAEAQRPWACGDAGGAEPPGCGTHGRGSWGRGSHRSPTEHGSALVLLGVEEGQDMVEDAVRDVGKTVLL
jgi:hypothetical protein